MEFLDRRRLFVGIALILCLVLLGRWAMLPDHVNAPQRVESPAAIDDPPAKALLPTVAESTSDIAPAPDDSSFGTLRGRVIDAVTREPVREFEVEFIARRATTKVRDDEAPGAQTFRTDDGRFEWQYLPPAKWTLTASARGYQRFELVDLEILSGEATREIVLPLRPGRELQGRVYDEGSGAGIASAQVGFREAHLGGYEGNWLARKSVITQKNGSFVLEGVPSGRLMLEIKAQDYATRDLVISVGQETSPLEIGLSAGGTIAGHLIAADGVTPVMGNIRLVNLDRLSGDASKTASAGEFSFARLAAGRYRLMGQSTGGAAEQEVVLASNGRIDGIVLTLIAGGSIRGVVTGLRPEDLKRTGISLRRNGDAADDMVEASSVDDAGAYVLHGVPAGRVQVVAHVSMRGQISRTIEMPANSDATVNLTFTPGVRLSGRITRGGKPLSGVSIQPHSVTEPELLVYGATSSADGKYAIEDLATGDYTVWVEEYVSPPVQVSGDTVFNVDVPLPQLSGRVLEEGGKLPVVGAVVEVWPAGPSSPGIPLNNRSDHFGQFALVGLEPGDFILSVYKPGYEMFRKPISYASPVAGMTISLRQNAGVEISARDTASGKPLQRLYASEEVGGVSSGVGMRLQLDENGIGYLPGALAGSTIAFSSSGYVPVVIRGWSGQRLDLQFVRKAVR